jgi:hypothetical protein
MHVAELDAGMRHMGTTNQTTQRANHITQRGPVAAEKAPHEIVRDAYADVVSAEMADRFEPREAIAANAKWARALDKVNLEMAIIMAKAAREARCGRGDEALRCERIAERLDKHLRRLAGVSVDELLGTGGGN